jgi:hypothetical protein
METTTEIIQNWEIIIALGLGIGLLILCGVVIIKATWFEKPKIKKG